MSFIFPPFIWLIDRGESKFFKNKTNAGDTRDADLVPGSGRFPRGGHGNPFQDSCLENPHGQRSMVGYKSIGSQRVEHD